MRRQPMPGSRGRGWFAVRGARQLAAAGARAAIAATVVVAILAGPAARTAGAAEATRVVSAFDDDNRFDFDLTLSFCTRRRAPSIKR